LSSTSRLDSGLAGKMTEFAGRFEDE